MAWLSNHEVQIVIAQHESDILLITKSHFTDRSYFNNTQLNIVLYQLLGIPTEPMAMMVFPS